MKLRTKVIAAALGLAMAVAASAQMIYGNSFEFWDVRGPLTTQTMAASGNVTVGGNLAVTGTTAVTGVQTFTAAPVISALTASLPVCTTSGKALSSCTQTGTGTVLVAATSPTLVTPTLGVALATSINGVTIPVTTGTVALLASPTFTGTVTTPAVVISTLATPASGDACTAGQFVGGSAFLYFCTASGAWKRVAITGGY